VPWHIVWSIVHGQIFTGGGKSVGVDTGMDTGWMQGVTLDTPVTPCSFSYVFVWIPRYPTDFVQNESEK
jgi:hypothetical protein